MNKRLKIIINYLLSFLLSVLTFLLLVLAVLKTTIYNPDFIKKEFKDNNYYSNLSKSIKNEMSNYIVQSGFPEEILDNIYTEKMLEENLNDIIGASYNGGRKPRVETKQVAKNLKNNINSYLEKNNIEVTDRESLTRFEQQIIEVYSNEISLSNAITYLQKIILKTNKIINIAIIILIILIIILIIYIKIKLKERALSIPLLTTGLLGILSYIYINSNITVYNIFIWDSNISLVLQSILSNILNKFLIIGIIFVILGCLDPIIDTIYKEKINYKRKHSHNH